VNTRNYKILIEPYSLSPETVTLVEKEYDAKYVCSMDGNELFYSKEPHPDSKSKYFVMFWKYNHDQEKTLLIASGEKYNNKPFYGYLTGDTIVYSRHRHDFYYNGGITVDGGPFYPRVLYDGAPP
jgi:hypothetical protein